MSNGAAEASPSGFREVEPDVWQIEPSGPMRVPGRIFASRELIDALDEKVREQLANVATLPGIVGAAFAMPDAHWGYGFPIGGVAAFDPDAGGIVSAGGVGFDISCGVRTFTTGMKAADLGDRLETVAHDLYRTVPAGVGWGGSVRLTVAELDEVLAGGAVWAVENGWGDAADLDRIEEGGRMERAEPSRVSARAKERQLHELGSLGSGNHYLELQAVERVFDAEAAAAYRLAQGDLLVTIHCGSRGLGHQIGTEYLQKFVRVAERYGIALPDRELACAPIRSPEGQEYLGAMRAAINCALANRQVIGALVRKVFARHFPSTRLELLYDVSHNTCKAEEHEVGGTKRLLLVHRKGATRALGPGHPDVPAEYRAVGQPVLIGGTMGTASYVLAGTTLSESRAFSSSCHGAGRRMSRTKAKTMWEGKPLIRELAGRGIVIKSHTAKGVAEEAPGAYKDVDEVARVAEEAGLSRRVARVVPLACVKG
jgi:tRNA-splicing ligase RtcB (3'-phosphate/5'-hydroxy nucleic acid ligase)